MISSFEISGLGTEDLPLHAHVNVELPARPFKDLKPGCCRAYWSKTASGRALQDQHFHIRPLLLTGIVICASALALGRLGLSVVRLVDGKPDDFLGFPLMVILPGTALFYLIRMPGTRTSEGAIMRLAALALILMILGMPAFALHLALGFPIAFLVVELFETRAPASMRDAIKRRLVL